MAYSKLDLSFIEWMRTLHDQTEIPMDSWLVCELKSLCSRNVYYDDRIEDYLTEDELLSSFELLLDYHFSKPFEIELSSKIKNWYEKLTDKYEKYWAVMDLFDILFHPINFFKFYGDNEDDEHEENYDSE